MLEPGGIIVADVNDKYKQTEDLPATRSMEGIPNDVSITFECMAPEEIKFDMVHPSTLTLTLLEPAVRLPIVKPLMTMENGDDALIPSPEMFNITELEEK